MGVLHYPRPCGAFRLFNRAARRGVRPRVRKTFIDIGPLERAEKRLRDTVSCLGDIQLFRKTPREIEMELSSKFAIGARVRMIGFENGTWNNGTEGIVTDLEQRNSDADHASPFLVPIRWRPKR